MQDLALSPIDFALVNRYLRSGTLDLNLTNYMSVLLILSAYEKDDSTILSYIDWGFSRVSCEFM